MPTKGGPSNRPFEEAEAAAQEAYEDLLDEEQAILAQSAGFAAVTIAGVAAKAAILTHYNGGLNFDAADVDVCARDSILRDLIDYGGCTWMTSARTDLNLGSMDPRADTVPTRIEILRKPPWR